MKIWIKLIYVSFSCIHKDHTIVLINIIFVIQYLQNPYSSLRIQQYSQRFYNCSYKDCICCTIFSESWLICQYPIVCTNIVFVFWYLLYSDSSIRIQCKYFSIFILTCPSGSNTVIVWVVSWIICQDPTQFFRIDLMLSLKTLPSSLNWDLLTCINQMVKLLSSNICWGSA